MCKACYILLIFTFVSCTSNTIFKEPEDLIEKKVMVDLLTDLAIATAAKNQKNIYGKRNVDYTQLVFEKYRIDTVRFKNSNFYYTSRIDDYQAIYLEVEKRIQEKEKQFKDLQKEKDSLKKDRLLKMRLEKDSILKKAIAKDSLILDALNKKMKDSTLHYNLKQINSLRNRLNMDSLRSVVKTLDTLKEISKDSL
jgi:hypothetical protein